MRDLGDFVPYAINDNGDMAGTCGDVSMPCALIDGIVHQIDVEHVGVGTDINNRGVVTGFQLQPVEDGLAAHAFTWTRSQGIRLLDAGDAYVTYANAINSAGVVAGAAAFHVEPQDTLQAARWRQESLELLDGPRWTDASGLNDRGWMVGTIWEGDLTNPGAARPLLGIPETLAIQLPAPDGLEGYYAADVANSGLIVGAAYRVTDGLADIHGVLWIVKHARRPR